MEGYVDKGKTVSLRGTLVPATKLNAIIASIPLVGDILVGTNTIIQDNPLLTCRMKKKGIAHPTRIVLDRRNRIPLKAKVFANGKVQRIIYISGPGLSVRREKSLAKKNIEVLKGKIGKSGFDLRYLMRLLVQKDLTSILIEGGSEMNSSAFSAGIVD